MYLYKQTMDNLIRKEVDSGQINGATALVLKGGKEKYYYE